MSRFGLVWTTKDCGEGRISPPLWRRSVVPLQALQRKSGKNLRKMWRSGVNLLPNWCSANKNRTDRQDKNCHKFPSNGQTDVRRRGTNRYLYRWSTCSREKGRLPMVET